MAIRKIPYFRTYSEKLQDPKWLQLRLDIKRRDNYKCLACGDGKSNLQVHHKMYGRDPWDVPKNQLETLCDKCHNKRTLLNKLLESIDSRSMLKLYDEIILYMPDNDKVIYDLIQLIREKDKQMDTLVKEFFCDKSFIMDTEDEC